MISLLRNEMNTTSRLRRSKTDVAQVQMFDFCFHNAISPDYHFAVSKCNEDGQSGCRNIRQLQALGSGGRNDCSGISPAKQSLLKITDFTSVLFQAV
jgi:hypothetical protein